MVHSGWDTDVVWAGKNVRRWSSKDLSSAVIEDGALGGSFLDLGGCEEEEDVVGDDDSGRVVESCLWINFSWRDGGSDVCKLL